MNKGTGDTDMDIDKPQEDIVENMEVQKEEHPLVQHPQQENEINLALVVVDVGSLTHPKEGTIPISTLTHISVVHSLIFSAS